ncbi:MULTISPECIES: hypothetical protein [Bacillus subtilis group]|uniref:hypothetical protein n=1 Tax=Bacillus subtilis group TaxID=653685 RepID=UPI00227ECEEC|nr:MULTISPECIES: hypothetical protein [Bacillus subtilis group]MCY8796303.1 hypothetical protein [Bacillus inaquosorum]MEC0771989.1 hypothetical protein [Bacillus inaquosorum]MEC0797358.1 hypothetical protein [Bacillus inaquosorum]MEC1684737.1 hypothetical protein [Bacillus mojavensis]MEC1706422.1 hypothetical protein [Bacillus mojavensis]
MTNTYTHLTEQELVTEVAASFNNIIAVVKATGELSQVTVPFVKVAVGQTYQELLKKHVSKLMAQADEVKKRDNPLLTLAVSLEVDRLGDEVIYLAVGLISSGAVGLGELI